VARLAVIAGLVAALAATATASAEQTPIPLKAPTGYKNLCDGAPRGKLGNITCPKGGLSPLFWRPLHLPQVAAGETCPVDTAHSISREISPVVGAGPVYLLAGSSPGNVLTMADPASEFSRAAGTGWGIGPLKLPLRTRFEGRFAIRGARIDAPGELGFSGPAGKRPFAALQFFPGSAYARTLSGKVRVAGGYLWATAPGCYAIQLDGTAFSRVIVFRVAFAHA